MSFNKIGNGYYNSDLCKCLLAIGGAYFVELKNGVKVNISKDDYDAMADGLLSVNGVKYCDPTLVASAKHIGAKYIVEFSNGNQFSISQSDYEGLIAAGFVAIGDIYYNPDDIDKVYAVAGGYFAEMVNGQKVVMTEEEYDAIVGGDQPTGLTPFEVGDQFVHVQLNTEMSDADVKTYLDSMAGVENPGIYCNLGGGVSNTGVLFCYGDRPLIQGYDTSQADSGKDIWDETNGWAEDWENQYCSWTKSTHIFASKVGALTIAEIRGNNGVTGNGVLYGKVSE